VPAPSLSAKSAAPRSLSHTQVCWARGLCRQDAAACTLLPPLLPVARALLRLHGHGQPTQQGLLSGQPPAAQQSSWCCCGGSDRKQLMVMVQRGTQNALTLHSTRNREAARKLLLHVQHPLLWPIQEVRRAQCSTGLDGSRHWQLAAVTHWGGCPRQIRTPAWLS
jgi:hypothetical protein